MAKLCTFDLTTGENQLVYESTESVIEAPNWSPMVYG